MAKKNDAFYFDSFASAAELACKAAQKLDEIMHDFDRPRSKRLWPRCTPSSRRPTRSSMT